ncbi:hypothetical protein V2J09_009454 [Rumex salicifolius]
MSNVHRAVEVGKTVVEVAELAWSAVEHIHHHHHEEEASGGGDRCLSLEDVNSLRSENQRLRQLLERNLELLQKLYESPDLFDSCPPDLHGRLVSAVDSKDFLRRIQSLKDATINGTSNEFPFKEATGADLDAAEILVNVDKEEPSWWVWVTDEMVPGTVEEQSGIDNDSYVIVWEDHVVDGVANFIARCVVSNPMAQKLTPEELQKTIAKSLAGVNKFEKMLSIWHAGKMFYALSTWGLALTGLYRSRAVLKLAVMGVHTTDSLFSNREENSSEANFLP